ncbi:basic chitinase [Actinidia rufa]|uniref:Basic chitinase n=1 Tax=Actinidia rufa TaxID=165716 RepID=A0A7J0ENR4_9ERIC|nr:basic chitinase [Actinidia rufa]
MLIPSGGGGGDISSVISRDLFEQLLKHRNDAVCEGKGFYSYDAFVSAAKSFGAFGNTGDAVTRKERGCCFSLSQTSHETTGGWPTAPDGPYAWGYCFVQEQGNPVDYCVPDQEWPCVPGKNNYNYGPAGRAIGVDLLNNPNVVAADPIISFKTALWFWMTPQSPKPSCHDVITGSWTPSDADKSAGRVPGYGVITNIINGGIECDKGSNPEADDRVRFYKRYCDIMGIGNYNYGPAGRAIGVDLLNNPNAVAADPIISFKTTLWFWMTPQSPKPSCHDVITGRWTPSDADKSAGRVPGYGVITNIINGGIECDKGSNLEADDRVGFYKRYCDIMGIGYGNNLDCSNQRPFA